MYSFSLNKYKNGRPICKIVGGNYDGNIIYCIQKNDIDEEKDDTLNKTFETIQLTKGKLELLLPKIERQRYVITAVGSSGSGKTTMINKLANTFYDENKNEINKVILFSMKNKEDEIAFSHDIKKNMLQVDLDGIWISENTLDIKNPDIKNEYTNTITIFDDINQLSTLTKKDKFVRDNIIRFRSMLLELSRSINNNIFITEHIITNSGVTKTILNESNIYKIGRAHV